MSGRKQEMAQFRMESVEVSEKLCACDIRLAK